MTNTEDARALADDLPFRVNSDGWGDVWIETASGRRIGDLDRRIDADELDAVFARMVDAPALPPPPEVERETLTPERAWQELLDKDDRTSPEEYPEMALITADELAGFMRAALPREGVRESAPTVVSGAWKDVSLSRLERVRAHRAEFGSDLKAAVDAVDAEAERQRIAALQPPHPDPAGGGELVWVPGEPTEEMILAGLEPAMYTTGPMLADAYRAMIAAAPGDQKCSGPDGPPGLGSTQLRRQSESAESSRGGGDAFPYREALHELVQLEAECEALNGGGPGWSERWARALANAEELVRREP